MRRREKITPAVLEVQKWFEQSVTYEGEPYVIDAEQAAAVMDASLNTIVVARAGSGKTRTLVAKVVYLVARCGVKSEEIMAFVFNHNAAVEINERLSKMRVDGEAVVVEAQIATTFHAFSRNVVYNICGGRERCKEILAGKKGEFVEMVTRKILRDEGKSLDEVEIVRIAGQMTSFVNRAQQQFMNGDNTLAGRVEKRLAEDDVDTEERKFVKLGAEVYRRYHWYLLDAKRGLKGFDGYGTDFNLIVSWASKLIAGGRKEVRDLLVGKKYILIDEYQDFSQLFLAAVEAIRSVATSARLFVVGDDWQAINRFAGSEVEYFKNFEEYFGEDCAKYEITTNYRCDRAIVEGARRFMRRAMREKGKFRAHSRKYGSVTVVNPRETELGYALVPYDKRVSAEDRILKKAAMKMGRATVKKSIVQYLKTVVRIVQANVGAKEILILHRNNEMSFGVSLQGFGEGLKWGLDRLGVLSETEFDGKVKLMTIHKSKGLEAEVVMILEADEGVIPKTHPDTKLFTVFGETEEVALADQKRLFYVAMTRAKKRLYVISEGGGFVKYLGKS